MYSVLTSFIYIAVPSYCSKVPLFPRIHIPFTTNVLSTYAFTLKQIFILSGYSFVILVFQYGIWLFIQCLSAQKQNTCNRSFLLPFYQYSRLIYCRKIHFKDNSTAAGLEADWNKKSIMLIVFTKRDSLTAKLTYIM